MDILRKQCHILSTIKRQQFYGGSILTRDHRSKRTILHLSVELFFAALPLIVLSSVWPEHDQPHPQSFWTGPEPSMTSCIIYGLTLARMMQGSSLTTRNAKFGGPDNTQGSEDAGIIYAFLSLIPILGVIVSVITIAKTIYVPYGWGITVFHVINLIIAASVFFVFGGHSIQRRESNGGADDTA
jgi:hypothetical protein